MIQIALHKSQIQVYEDTHRFRVVCAGRRWGKTVLSQIITLDWATQKDREGLYWIISPNYRQAEQIHWRHLKALVPREWVAKYLERPQLSIELKNGSIIELKGAENPDTLRGVKLRGLVVDEIASIRNWDWLWNEVLRATLTDYEAPTLFISTPKGYNHFYDLYQLGQGTHEFYKSWRYSSYDNPYIKKEEIDNAKKELTEDTFAQEYMADFRKFTGLVYKEFQREVHIIEPFDIPEGWQVYRGVDFGSTNPTACLWIAVDNDENWFVCAEHYATGETIDYHAGLINANSLSVRVQSSFGDPSGAQWISEFAQRGIYITPANKEVGTNFNSWVRFGIEKVSEKLKRIPGHSIGFPINNTSGSGNGGGGLQSLSQDNSGRPSLFIFRTCENLIREFETYRWKEKSVTQAQDLNEPDVPEKANDHCFTGDTMILTKTGWKRIDKIKKGEYVWSPFGWNEVYRAGSTGIKKVKDYRVFRATPDHKVLTNHGLVEVDSLGYSDRIMVWENQKPFTFKEFLTAVIQLPIKDQIGFILGAVLMKSLMARRAFYIETYGNTIMAKFLMVIWYIILTGILSITTLVTLSLSVIVNMLKSISGVFGKEWSNTSTVFGFSQKNGMGQMKESIGIRSMERKHGKLVNTMFENAMYVVHHTKHHLFSDQNIVRGIAKPLHLEDAEVFNLATRFGMYFANGILVSNSMDALRYFAVSYTKLEPEIRTDFSQWKI